MLGTALASKELGVDADDGESNKGNKTEHRGRFDWKSIQKVKFVVTTEDSNYETVAGLVLSHLWSEKTLVACSSADVVEVRITLVSPALLLRVLSSWRTSPPTS